MQLLSTLVFLLIARIHARNVGDPTGLSLKGTESVNDHVRHRLLQDNNLNSLNLNYFQPGHLFGAGFEQYLELEIQKDIQDVITICYPKCMEDEACSGFGYRVDDRYDERPNGNCWFMTGEVKYVPGDSNVDQGGVWIKLEDLSEDESCTDVSGWYDADGPDYDCDWYAGGYPDDYCATCGHDYSNQGHTANSACCSCGGGGTSTPAPVTPATLRKFSDKQELQMAVEKYMDDKDAWAESDCDGTPCGDYYGYAKLLTWACARKEIRELNGGSPFAFVSTIIAVLP
jgi:hypothetical protein